GLPRRRAAGPCARPEQPPQPQEPPASRARRHAHLPVGPQVPLHARLMYPPRTDGRNRVIRSVWTFPGQLTEYVGMGGGLLEGSRAFAERCALASRLADVDLARVCREGPEDLLHRDDCAALAVVAAGTAAAEELRGSGYAPD